VGVTANEELVVVGVTANEELVVVGVANGVSVVVVVGVANGVSVVVVVGVASGELELVVVAVIPVESVVTAGDDKLVSVGTGDEVIIDDDDDELSPLLRFELAEDLFLFTTTTITGIKIASKINKIHASKIQNFKVGFFLLKNLILWTCSKLVRLLKGLTSGFIKVFAWPASGGPVKLVNVLDFDSLWTLYAELFDNGVGGELSLNICEVGCSGCWLFDLIETWSLLIDWGRVDVDEEGYRNIGSVVSGVLTLLKTEKTCFWLWAATFVEGLLLKPVGEGGLFI